MKLLSLINGLTFKSIFIAIVFIISLNSNYFCINGFITLPFAYINKKTKNSNPIESTPKDNFESFIDNSVFTTIKIENKDIKFHLSTERHTIYISENTISQNINKNDEKKIENKNNLYSLEYIGISKAEFTNSSFLFLLNNTNILAKNISYFIVKQLYKGSNNFTRLSSYINENEEIGFNIYKGNQYERVVIGDDDEIEDFYDDIFDFDDNKTEINKTDKKMDKNKLLKNGGYNIEEDTNLIKQLKKKDLISSYTFLIKYNNKNDEKGEIIIGGLPHEYDKRHFSEDYFIYDFVPLGNDPPYNWHTFFDKITFGDKSIVDKNNHTYYRHSVFSLDFGFILASFIFKEYFYDNFFNKYKDLCFEENIDKYVGIYCKEEVIKNFENISFYLSTKYYIENNNNKIEFDYKDLFIKSKGNNNLYYFQIIFTEYTNRWILGRPLFKKYPTIFDQDKKMFGFYLKTGEYDVLNKDNNNENEEKNIPWSLIIIIFLSICVIVLGIILYKVITIMYKRKKKANELDDDFIYETEEKEEKGLFKN